MTEAEVMKLFLDREPGAVDEANAAYGGYLHAVAFNVLGDPAFAEECVNDALLAAWGSIPPDEPQELLAYLSRITRNIALNRLKSERALKRGGTNAERALTELDGIVSGNGDPEEAAELNELTREIERFLETLPEKERRIFVDRYWYYDDIPAIAKRLGKNSNYVSVHLMRLRRKLANHLIERGFDL